MPIIDWTPQGSLGWYHKRAGIPTASQFDQVMAPKQEKMSEARHKYACRLIAARLLNWQEDTLDKIDHIQAGKDNEPIAVARLELIHDIATQPVGFITTTDGRFGASPDRVVMSGERVQNTIEVKCPTIPKQFEYLLLGHEAAYRCQVQGQLWIAEADKAIFLSYNSRTPDYMVETGRDEPFIKKLSDALEQFSDELEALMEKAKRLGIYQAFQELAAPVDATFAPEDTAALARLAEPEGSMET
jgi:hypothetical protein